MKTTFDEAINNLSTAYRAGVITKVASVLGSKNPKRYRLGIYSPDASLLITDCAVISADKVQELMNLNPDDIPIEEAILLPSKIKCKLYSKIDLDKYKFATSGYAIWDKKNKQWRCI